MKNLTILMALGVIAIGLFAMPNTLSLFQGQHSWNTAGGSGSEMSTVCIKCHADIVDELVASPYHSSRANTCRGCHATDTSTKSANMTRQGFHAATTLECISCHTGTVATDNVYNTTDGNWYATSGRGAGKIISYGSLLSNQEAHKTFYEQSASTKAVYNNDGSLKYGAGYGVQNITNTKGSNAACIGCHTHAGFNTSFVPNPNGMNVEITYDPGTNLPTVTYVENMTI